MELYFKASDLEDFDTLTVKKIAKYVPLEKSDILKIDDLLSIIQELCYELDKRDEEIEDLKSYIRGEDDRDPRDYNDSYMDE